jgi:hypothetical protein
MKALAILMKAILLIFTINAIGQETHYDWVKLNLDGQVKSININEFIASEESGNIIKNGKQKAFNGFSFTLHIIQKAWEFKKGAKRKNALPGY